jgi:hypothetical protein
MGHDVFLAQTAREVARDRHVVSVEGHVEHLVPRTSWTRRHTLPALFRLKVEDRYVGYAVPLRCSTREKRPPTQMLVPLRSSRKFAAVRDVKR